MEVPIHILTDIPSILDVFGSPSTCNSLPDPLRTGCLSPVCSITLQRVSPYSLDNPGRLLRRSMPPTGMMDEPQSPPPSWSSNEEADAASSFLSQVFDEMARVHLEVGGFLPGYLRWLAPPDSDTPYGGRIVPQTFYYEVTNWQKDCTPLYAMYPL